MQHTGQRADPINPLFGDIPPAVGSFLMFMIPSLILSIVLAILLYRHRERNKVVREIIRDVTTNYRYLSSSDSAAPARARILQSTSYLSPRPQASSFSAEVGVKTCSLTAYWDNKTPFRQLAQTVPLDARRELLDTSLRAHETGWLDKLLCSCLLVIGRPGSAKSSFAGALAISREVILNPLNETVVADPNAHLKVGDRIWQACWTLQGSHDAWGEIEDAMRTMYRRFADSQGRNYVSSVYDELTTYESKLDANILSGFIEQITSKARASNEYITLVSHNDTLTCLGAKKGQARLKDDMVKLSLGSRSVARGKFQATGKGCIEGLEFDDKNNPLEELITLPRWFEPKVLIELFPELYSADLEGSRPASGATSTDFQSTSTSAREVGGSGAEVNDGSRGSDHLSRRLRLEALRRKLEVEVAEVSTSTLEAVIDALEAGHTTTHIVEEILGYKGRSFSKGKYILKIIEEFNSNETDF